MKKISLYFAFIVVTILLFEGCDKVTDILRGKKDIYYSCTNGSGSTASISYVNEAGDNVFVDVAPRMTWGESIEAKKGDWVRLQAQSGANTGELKISIACEGCSNFGMKDEKLSASVNLSVRNIVELSATVE